MQRRLNPQIFDEGGSQQMANEPSFSAVSHQRLQTEVSGLKKTLAGVDNQLEALKVQFSHFSEHSEKRQEVQSQALAQIEQESREQNLRLTQQIRHLEEKVSERRVIEGKIEILVDRYNMSLQQFENRLTSLQKVISEKEMTLMKYNSAIEQIFREIEKLKNTKV